MDQDIKARMTKLEKENKELKMTFQLNSDEIFVTDANGVCLMVNPIAQKHYGIKESDLVGMNVLEMSNNKLFYPSATLKVIEEQTPVTLIQSTSDNRWLHVTSAPVFNEQGILIRVISNSRDITELFILRQKVKEMEKMIEKYNFQLENLRKENQEYGEGIIAKSETMVNILKLLERVSKVDSTILLLGESGVGKTKIARFVHNQSNRKNFPFIEVNCAAIPASLFESELFGYEPGAFSGATARGQKGLLEAAQGGTIFLDEISELSLELQTKLLQAIQNKSFLSVGGRETKHVDVRIIAATNQDLEKMVDKKEFREDLYYRLAVVPIKIPRLRERKEDLLHLTTNFLEQINKKYDFSKVISPNLMEYILSYDWPGNVRELENTIERLVVTSEHSVIDSQITPSLNEKTVAVKLSEKKTDLQLSIENSDLGLVEMLDKVEEQILRNYMKKLGSTRKVAEALHSSQSTISRKCNKYGILTHK